MCRSLMCRSKVEERLGAGRGAAVLTEVYRSSAKNRRKPGGGEGYLKAEGYDAAFGISLPR